MIEIDENSERDLVYAAYNELGEMYDKLVEDHGQLVEQFLRTVEAHTSLTRTYLSLLAGLGK